MELYPVLFCLESGKLFHSETVVAKLLVLWRKIEELLQNDTEFGEIS